MPLDHYVTLGRSGLRVSPFCLGAMTFGEDWGWGSSVKESEQIIDRFIDAAATSSTPPTATRKGHSEKIIGDHIGRHPGKRDRLVIATKFIDQPLSAAIPTAAGEPQGDRPAMRESLRRLQTDYIDLYWLHVWDRITPIEETHARARRSGAAGKVRYIGFSDTPAWKVAEAQTMAPLRD